MFESNILHREVCTIPGYEEFVGYYIDIEGNLYSTRRKNVNRIKPFWSGTPPHAFQKVFLYSKTGRRKINTYLHLLVAKAFMPKSMMKRYIIHKTNNREDNSLNNLISIHKKVFKEGHKAGRPRKTREQYMKEMEKEYILSDKMISELNLVYSAALKKGLHLGKSFDFVNEIVEELLDDYCNRKGLKKILHQMKQEL